MKKATKSPVKSETTKPASVPATRNGGGNGNGERRRGKFLKFVDGAWSVGGVTVPPGLKLIVRKTYSEVNHWQGGKPVETLPDGDVDALNDKIPASKWEKDRSGNPRKPWSKAVVVELVNPSTYERYRFANNSTGAYIAYDELRDCIESRIEIEGEKADPVVELGSAMMPTRHGKDVPRPVFALTGQCGAWQRQAAARGAESAAAFRSTG
jgi:hypothetical protein